MPIRDILKFKKIKASVLKSLMKLSKSRQQYIYFPSFDGFISSFTAYF